MQVYKVREAARDWPGGAQDMIEDLEEARGRCKDSETYMAQQVEELMSDQQPDTHGGRQRHKELWDGWKRAK
jgi:hypothetical protein